MGSIGNIAGKDLAIEKGNGMKGDEKKLILMGSINRRGRILLGNLAIDMSLRMEAGKLSG